VTRSPTLGVFLNGVPDFETLFPVIARLQSRGDLRLRVYATTKMMRLEPRIRALLKEAGIRASVWPNRLQKMAFPLWMRGIDAVLTLGDPLTDVSGHKRRMRYLARTGMPTIYLQHGVIQLGLTYAYERDEIPFHSNLIYLFEPLAENRALFSEDTRSRMRVSGFLKQAVLPPKSVPQSIAGTLASYKQRILLCHSFRWNSRFPAPVVQDFYEMVEAFAKAHPETGLIIRSHRGKRRSMHASFDDALAKRCPNIHFSYHHQGALKRLSITDALALADMMVTTASTTVLDAAYLDKPVALYRNDSDKFQGLPNIETLPDLEHFAAHPETTQPALKALRNHYGDLETNLTRTADEIAGFMAKRFGA
jgi:hypothetical protein